MIKSLLFICSKLPVSIWNYKKCSISTTAACSIIQAYRKEKGLPLNPNSSGPLTDLPDYTYLNGKPTPLGMNQNKRMNKQVEMTKRIIKLSKELDFAVQRHADKIKNEEEARKDIIRNKLKPKGHLLLKKK